MLGKTFPSNISPGNIMEVCIAVHQKHIVNGIATHNHPEYISIVVMR